VELKFTWFQIFVGQLKKVGALTLPVLNGNPGRNEEWPHIHLVYGHRLVSQPALQMETLGI
jgi:alanine-alpha-ketoisovalerate/valine-pyruvate aminotransferase